ncbi:HU family DNA-binding protein [Patescibacteria group bacterium]|nr:HU family DNA-binding protein [Patescibacteria group bacterium]
MTKIEVAEAIAERTGMTKRAAADALNAFVDVVGETLARGEKVTVTGFGTFVVRRRAARMGRNPQTGEPLHIPAQNSPAFRAGTGLKDMIR